MNKLLLVFCLSISIGLIQGQELQQKLELLSQSHAFHYELADVDSFFSEKYVLYFEQPVDHQNPEGPAFSQRVFLSHRSFDAPVVFITEGYGAEYAAHPAYKNELTTLINANQVCVEHRYFGRSVPEPIVWDQLTVANAAADHHRIVQLLKQLYSGKWINTGISKGGQTAMYHRFFFPEDVDITVAYVCPLNFSKEEQRIYRFLDRVGDSSCRNSVINFQKELFRNKTTYFPYFDSLAHSRNLVYRMGVEKAYELTVLEFSFAFWQWQADCAQIPRDDLSPASMIGYLDRIAGLDWISDSGIEKYLPFYYQAMREIGFYGYNISPFKEWVSYTSNPTFEFTLPEGVRVSFDPEPMQKVDYFIRHEAQNMIFIYGEDDPWSAPAVELTYHTNSVKIVKPGGTHRTRISNLPDDQKKQVIQTLNEWMNR